MADPSRTERGHTGGDACACGVCGADVPPLIGSVLTGTGLTVGQAAAAIQRDEHPALTDVQQRIVERWALEHGV
jgi:hypothetical protein